MSATVRELAVVAVLAVVACEKKATPPVVVELPAVTAPSAEPAASAHPHVQKAKVEFPEVPIRAGAPTTVRVTWNVPPGTAVNEDAPFRVRWNRSDALAEAPADVKATGTSARNGFDIVVKPLGGAPNATLGGVIDLVVCDAENHSVCLPVRRAVEIEFVVGKGAAAETTVTIPLPQARGS